MSSLSPSQKELMKRYDNIKFGNPNVYLAGIASAFVLFNCIYYWITRKYWNLGGVEMDVCVEWEPSYKIVNGKKTRTSTCIDYERKRQKWPLVLLLVFVNIAAYWLSSSVISLWVLLLNPDLLRMRIVAWVVGESVGSVRKGFYGR